ncbi:Phosphopantetheinyl transferase PptB [Penicillium chermesinum]|uniref:Phosphopantetheinyl transferase PptB n=1 Tax=Penicillium chermesinum TaxID=63820 RepID=A0A9W9TJX4_9EURO|nr:Phosphopantetheinyl transferase PptB [Penicillium chermesinum]KAJ5225453.1 Phosphopantetheinyl transferase PptB [Penicillium chermesinum]KAJ6161319.1 Phosphopantetheinyl transferase PptB [Penicillium chermesinum]
MKPLPFPYPINIGTDIVHLPRIAALLTRRDESLTRFTGRILCTQEQDDFRRRFHKLFTPQPPNIKPPTIQKPDVQPPVIEPATSCAPPISAEMTRWLAGRFAAKEAARKAAPEGAASIGWKDVMVRVQERTPGNTKQPSDSRRPEIVYLGDEERGIPARIGQLSISHDGEYVVATVLAAG